MNIRLELRSILENFVDIYDIVRDEYERDIKDDLHIIASKVVGTFHDDFEENSVEESVWQSTIAETLKLIEVYNERGDRIRLLKQIQKAYVSASILYLVRSQ